MKRLLVVLPLLCVVVMGCAGANITSSLRQSRLGVVEGGYDIPSPIGSFQKT